MGGRKDQKGAEQSYRKAIELNPKCASAHNALGVLLGRQRGKVREEEACYRKAIAAKPDTATYHCNLGILLRDRKDKRGAEAAFRQAITVNPAFTRAHELLAKLQ